MDGLRQVLVTIIGNKWEGDKLVNEVFTGAFHRWEDYKDQYFSCTYAIVELEDGNVQKYAPEDIKFTGKIYGREEISKEAMDAYLKY